MQGEAEASVHHARKLVTTTGLDFQTVGQDHLWCAPALRHSVDLPFLWRSQLSSLPLASSVQTVGASTTVAGFSRQAVQPTLLLRRCCVELAAVC